MGRGLSDQQKDILRFMLALHRHHGGTDYPRYDRIDTLPRFVNPVAIVDGELPKNDYRTKPEGDEYDPAAAAFYVSDIALAVLENDRMSNAERASMARAHTRLGQRGLWIGTFAPDGRYLGTYLTESGIQAAVTLPPMDLPHADFVLRWCRYRKTEREVLLNRHQTRKPVQTFQPGNNTTDSTLSVKPSQRCNGFANSQWLPIVTEHGVIEVQP